MDFLEQCGALINRANIAQDLAEAADLSRLKAAAASSNVHLSLSLYFSEMQRQRLQYFVYIPH